jgi:SAM-dependent methyltransferase
VTIYLTESKEAKNDSKILCVELGGGTRPKKGFVNLDQCPTADIKINFNKCPLPFEDATVDEIYSSHCLEHVKDLWGLIYEICRVCKVGATVTIKVPHYNNPMAMCPGHYHVISELMISHFEEFPEIWNGKTRKLVLQSELRSPTALFNEARSLTIYNCMTDDQIMKFVSGTCHDTEFVFKVERVG